MIAGVGFPGGDNKRTWGVFFFKGWDGFGEGSSGFADGDSVTQRVHFWVRSNEERK